MAKKDFYVHLDLNSQELQNSSLEKLSSTPATLYSGRTWLNTSDKHVYYVDIDNITVIRIPSNNDLNKFGGLIGTHSLSSIPDGATLGQIGSGVDESGASLAGALSIQAGDYWVIGATVTIAGVLGESNLIAGDTLTATVDGANAAAEFLGSTSVAAGAVSDGNGIYDGSGSLAANTIIQQNAFNLELQGNGGLFTTNANTSWAIGAVLNSGFQVYQVVSTHSTGHYIIQTKSDVSSDVYGQRIYSNSAKTGAATLYGTHNDLVGTHALGTNVAGYFNAENALNNYSALFNNGDIGFEQTAATRADIIKIVQSLGSITFDGTTGGLFSITDDKSGQLFGVADVSGNDIMYADADWLIKLGNPFQTGGVPLELDYNSTTGDTTLATNAIDVNLNNYLITSTATPANIDVTKSIIKIRTTTSGDLLDLPDGVDGQIITLLYTAETAGGDFVRVTPTNLTGFTDIRLNNVGEGCELYFTDGSWIVKSNNGTVIA